MRALPTQAVIFLWLSLQADFAGAAPRPDLDCALGFDGLKAFAASLPGAETGSEGSARVAAPDSWRVEFAFSEPGDPAHPFVSMRTFVKQVTGVWTAQSKGCGYGDQTAFAEAMAGMKVDDRNLTEASRAETERAKREGAPLGR